MPLKRAGIILHDGLISADGGLYIEARCDVSA